MAAAIKPCAISRLWCALIALIAFSAAAAAPTEHAACRAIATPPSEVPDPAACTRRAGIVVAAGDAGRAEAAKRLYDDASDLIDKRRFDVASDVLNCAEALLGNEWRHRYELARRRGVLAYRQDRVADALVRFQCALDIASTHQDRAAVAKSLNNVGSTLRRLGDYRNALQLLTRSLEMQRADGGATGLVLMNLGDLYRDLKAPAESLSHYQEAIDAFRRGGDPIESAHVLESMAAIAFEKGDMANAHQWLEAALVLLKENNSLKYQPRVYAGLIQVALKRADLDQAQVWSTEAIPMINAYDSPAPLQLQIARLDRARGKSEAASVRVKQAIAALSAGDIDRVDLLQELASIQETQGDLHGSIATMRIAQAEARALDNARHDLELGWQRSRFEAADRERTISTLEAKNRLRSIQLWLTAATAAIAILSIFLLSMRRRQRARLAETAREVRHEQALARYQRETDALAEDRNLLQVLLDSRDDAVCLLDAEGQLMAANRSARRLLDTREITGTSFVLSQCLDEAGRDALASALERMEDSAGQTFEFARPDNAFPLNARLTQWEQGDGLIVLALEEAAKPMSASTTAPASVLVHAQDEPGARADFRRDLVELMLAAIDLWERSSGCNRLELAERSRIWRVNIDDGRLRARSMDRYLSLSKLPQNPRWRDVLRTAYFVMGQCPLETTVRDDLQRRIDAVLGYTRRSALV
jgi:two-component system, sensor histidine kinase ChiS